MPSTFATSFSLTDAELPDARSDVALKHMISCTLEAPPSEAANPTRKLAGSGPFDAMIDWCWIR